MSHYSSYDRYGFSHTHAASDVGHLTNPLTVKARKLDQEAQRALDVSVCMCVCVWGWGGGGEGGGVTYLVFMYIHEPVVIIRYVVSRCGHIMACTLLLYC